MNSDVTICLGAFAALTVMAWLYQRHQDRQGAGAYWHRKWSHERRDNARLRNELDQAEARLKVAEEINALPCQCGCDRPRVEYVYDGQAFMDLYDDIAAVERGESL